jgi:hypothetical protein
MPWKECSVMDERVKFVARRLAGEPMADLCREFGISRKTGYKIFDRYQVRPGFLWTLKPSRDNLKNEQIVDAVCFSLSRIWNGAPVRRTPFWGISISLSQQNTSTQQLSRDLKLATGMQHST